MPTTRTTSVTSPPTTSERAARSRQSMRSAPFVLGASSNGSCQVRATEPSESPVARALMGKAVGDEVGASDQELEIISIS